MRQHAARSALLACQARFIVVAAGRRSGKTEDAKRHLIVHAMTPCEYPDPRFFLAAPTRDQAKAIYWADLKSMVHSDDIKSIRESVLCVTLLNGAEIYVIGMDKPQRIEGRSWNGGILDEYADMKSSAWAENVRPALSDRGGWCWLIGVPNGRNHFYDLAAKAKQDTSGEWAFFSWNSSEVLSPYEIGSAERDLDESTFRQEYEASFETLEGRCYYGFAASNVGATDYDPDGKLILCFDFNVEPGVAVICQESADKTMVVGEVHIPRNSNTPAVCRKIVQDWGQHRGRVVCYGDATGGARGTSKVSGSDWDIIWVGLKETFRNRLSLNIGKSNPPEKRRVNAVNGRICSHEGKRRLLVDPSCVRMIEDLDGVVLLAGGSGEIDKRATPKLTHLSDALGYYLAREFPGGEKPRIKKEKHW